MASASDVPHRFDVVISGEGYCVADREEVKAQYGYSPTFVPRSNITGNYGDNQQDFWLTATQRDWSLGEQQKFLRVNDDVGQRRYWQGEAVDIRVPGQVTLRQATRTLTFAAQSTVGTWYSNSRIVVATGTNLYTVDAAGTITDLGAHGLGGTPQGICCDSVNLFLCASGVNVRKYDGATFASFSATGARQVEYLNNAIYGLAESSSALQLQRYDTAGAPTVLHQWLTGLGGNKATIGAASTIKAFGGKLLILLALQQNPELWQYDGTGVSQLASFPSNFSASNVEVLHGLVFVSGLFTIKSDGTTHTYRPGIYFYANGQVGLLWKADGTLTSGVFPGMASYDSGLIFADDTRGQIMYYDIVNGGVHAVCSYTVSGTMSQLIAARRFFVQLRFLTTAIQYPDAATIASTGTITGSLTDFDTSLKKIYRGILVDFDEGSGGDGGSIDIAYRLADPDGAYTTLQSDAASGTEYTLSNITGRSMSVKLTLNKGTSTNGPTVKRSSLRAVPLQQTFRQESYVLNCTGRNGEQHIQLRDGTLHPKDGLEMATDLRTAATSATPITVTDVFGTFTGIIEPDGFELLQLRPEEFLARVNIREV